MRLIQVEYIAPDPTSHRGCVIMVPRLSLMAWLGFAALAWYPLSTEPLAAVSRGEPPSARKGDPLPAGVLLRLRAAGQRELRAITCLAFSPDGKSLLAFDADRRLTVWDLPTGTTRTAFGSDQPADAVALTHFCDCLADAVYDADGMR